MGRGRAGGKIIMSLDFYEGKRIVVTGGASFIGSHLVDKLVSLGAEVTVVDNLSSGKLENLENSIDKIKFIKLDLEYASLNKLVEVFSGNEVVFHLAACLLYTSPSPRDRG